MTGFWGRLPRPFFMLAPMEDVTDVAFRTLIARESDPAIPRVMYTEFTAADGIVRADEKGQQKLRKKLSFTEHERPIVAQLFTSIPEHMEQAARLCAELGFDGVDINMGCPDKAIERQGCGAAMIKTPDLAREIIRAAKRGAGDVPVSVKTRLGYNDDQLESWLPVLLEEEPAIVVVHARTRKELSEVPARWERVARAVAIRDSLGSQTLIGGNGDVRDMADARQKAAATGADGVMLGRAVFGNPWLFTEEGGSRTPAERTAMLIEHIRLFQEHMTGFVSDALMRKHFKAYVSGWDHAGELRARLMDADSLDDVVMILESFRAEGSSEA